MSRACSEGPSSRRPDRRRLFLAGFPVALLVLALGGRAFADPLALTLLGDLAGADVTITYTAPTPDYPNGFTLNGFAGEMLLQTGANIEGLGFCVDLAHFVGVGQTFLANSYRSDSPTNGLTNGAQVAYLANTYASTSMNDVQGAGLQIAIWSELYDNGTGFSSGVFQYTAAENAGDPNYSAIAAAATAYLNDAQGNSSEAEWYDASPSGTGQWRGQSMIDPVVPAPSSLVLSLLGVGCLSITSIRRRRLLWA